MPGHTRGSTWSRPWAGTVGDHVVVVERDRSPQLAADLGDQDHATWRAVRVELGEAVDVSVSDGQGVAVLMGPLWT